MATTCTRAHAMAALYDKAQKRFFVDLWVNRRVLTFFTPPDLHF